MQGRLAILGDRDHHSLHEDGKPMGFAKVTQDSTQNHEQQSTLERQEQLERFVAAISHDLQNPLSVVGGHIELARETGDISRLDAAEAALEQATELLDYLRRLTVEGKEIMDLEPVDLAEVAEAAWASVETEGVTLAIEGSMTLTADRQQLRQLLENLFGNAVEHPGPDVRVTVGRLDEGGFYVEDNGPGIPEAERAEVFRLGYSSTADGTGFGLAICRQIAKAHGWFIDVVDGTDSGARFGVSSVETE